MKKFYLLLAAVIVVTGANAAAAATPVDVTSLSNKDVVLMVEQKVSSEAIIKAIKMSPCTFDTFPTVMKELKRRGVPDEVLQAMIDAPYGPATDNRDAADLAEDAPIYHFTENIKQYLTPVNTGRRHLPTSNRTRAARRTSRW